MSEPSVADLSKPRKANAKNSYTSAYESLWASYPSTQGMSKLDGFKAWQKLTAEEQAQVVASIPAYVALLKRETWRKPKHLQGYINARIFETVETGNVTELETPAKWQGRLDSARQGGAWASWKWGPMPGASGCRVPANLLQPGDGNGWREERAA